MLLVLAVGLHYRLWQAVFILPPALIATGMMAAGVRFRRRVEAGGFER